MLAVKNSGAEIPSGNEIIQRALAMLADGLTKAGHRWTPAELDLVERAEAALGSSGQKQ